MKENFKENTDKVDIEAWASFYIGVINGTIKVVCRFNYHSRRHIKINKEGTTNSYPQCIYQKT